MAKSYDPHSKVVDLKKKQKAVGKKSRAKGATYERKKAKQLSEWCGFDMKRTPMSGGWAKTGDLTPVNPADMVKFPFCMEMKNREGWFLSDVITGVRAESGIFNWWKQVREDSNKSEKIPLLVFTRNLDTDYIMMEWPTFEDLLSNVWSGHMKSHIRLYDEKTEDEFAILLFDDFLKNVKYKALAKLWSIDE